MNGSVAAIDGRIASSPRRRLDSDKTKQPAELCSRRGGIRMYSRRPGGPLPFCLLCDCFSAGLSDGCGYFCVDTENAVSHGIRVENLLRCEALRRVNGTRAVRGYLHSIYPLCAITSFSNHIFCRCRNGNIFILVDHRSIARMTAKRLRDRREPLGRTWYQREHQFGWRDLRTTQRMDLEQV